MNNANGSSNVGENADNSAAANNSNDTNNSTSTGPRVVTAADIPMQLKAKYFGSGMAVGVLVAPAVRRAAGLLKTLYTQAGDLVEKGSDALGRTKDVEEKGHEGHFHN